MPPEQLFNRQLTKASDLYSLGVTLVCLLTRTKSTAVGNFIDEAYRIDFKVLASKLNPQFIVWLEKMTEPNFRHRYPNAAIALSALIPINVVSKLKIKERLVRFIPAIAAFIVLDLIAVGLIDSFGKLFVTLFQNESSQIESYGDDNNKILQIEGYRDDNAKNFSKPIEQLLATHQCPKCDLRHADLRGMNLTNVNLQDANLEGANLAGTNLTNANLAGAYLEGANLRYAILKSAKLWSASLIGANLEHAILRNSIFTGANLENAYLWSANLYNADLRNANLKYADLRDTDLYTPALDGANLDRANLTGARTYSLIQPGISLKGTLMPDGKVHD
jgi:uncharacterized protein YjbI with pentapeptide repeats